MSSTRKIVLSIFTLVCVVAVSVMTVAVVLSASTQGVSSNLVVRYNAVHVNATASAVYQTEANIEKTNLVGADGNATSVKFGLEQSSTTATLQTPQSVALSKSNSYALFTYKFTNDNPSGGHDLLITVADASNKSNVNVWYYASGAELLYETMIDGASTIKTQGTTTETTLSQLVYAGNSAYFYVLVEVDKLYTGAVYESLGDASLNWSLANSDTINGTTISE